MVLQHVAVATRVSLISLSQVLWIWLMSRSILRRDSGPARACTNTLDALHRCKRELGLSQASAIRVNLILAPAMQPSLS